MQSWAHSLFICSQSFILSHHYRNIKLKVHTIMTDPLNVYNGDPLSQLVRQAIIYNYLNIIEYSYPCI